MDDKLSRDYDTNSVGKDDRRFVLAAREGVVTQITYFVTCAIALIVAYSLCPEDPADVTYFLGYPSWLCAGCGIWVAATLLLFVFFLRAKPFHLGAKDNGEEV